MTTEEELLQRFDADRQWEIEVDEKGNIIFVDERGIKTEYPWPDDN